MGVEKGIRLLGITLTNLDPMTYENIVLPLWENQEYKTALRVETGNPFSPKAVFISSLAFDLFIGFCCIRTFFPNHNLIGF